MNQRTARLINRYCANERVSGKEGKRIWRRTPHTKRHRMRKEMVAALKEKRE